MGIGKIVRSESHVRYTCQIYGPGEVAAPPEPAAYGFGSFVRMPLRTTLSAPDAAAAAPRRCVPPRARAGPALWAVGLIYDTLLVNPAFGTLGPRLSNEEQVASSRLTISRSAPCSSRFCCWAR